MNSYSAFLLTGFILGIAGSFHCAGMCGPIALVLPSSQEASRKKIIAGRLLYNAGRIITYCMMGFLAGWAGYAASLRGFQRELSVCSGVAIIVFVLLSGRTRHRISASGIIAKLNNAIRRPFKKLFQKGSMLSLLIIGLLNGLIPCGMVYIALAASAASPQLSLAVSYMFFFGLGTLPMMFLISLGGNYIALRSNKLFRRFSPFIAIAIALLLIWRGGMPVEKHCCAETKTGISSCH